MRGAQERYLFIRQYFESGCICILARKLEVDSDESDEVASTRYLNDCKCSRHPEGEREWVKQC